MHARRIPTTKGETIRPLSHWRMSLVGFESNASDWWSNYWPMGQCHSRPKASGKIRVLYISLCNIRWVISGQNRKKICLELSWEIGPTYSSGTISLALTDELFKSWYFHFFLNTYITNLLQNLKKKIAKNSYVEIGPTYSSGTISLALTDELFKSWYFHYFLNTYITNLLQN